MKKLQTIAVLFMGVAVLVMGFLLYKQLKVKAGSIVIGNDYLSTSTSPTFAVAPAFKVIKTGPGSLGSAVVTIVGAGAVINFYDATTTGPHSDHSTTTLASLSTATAGTFTFDVQFGRGLVVETVGANTGTTTITYR